MAKIFINYRRDDTAGYAGRLHDRLASHFGDGQIFMDIDQIEPGEDFVEVIHEKLRSVQVAVVLIGKQWLDITDASGRRRLDHPDDFVRLEIVTLLERKIRVIPVRVGGAGMPEASQLPECLAPLPRRHAYEISNNRFHSDVDKLIQVLEKAMGMQTPTPPSARPDPPRIPFTAIFGVLAILLGAFGLFHYFSETEQKIGIWISQQLADKKTSEAKLPFEPAMIRIPPGKFLMGSDYGDDEEPQHEVTIAYAFEIGKFEVTFEEYDAFAKATSRQLPKDRGWGRGSRPVIGVLYGDAQAYVKWLSDKTGKRYRLPTEAEWEYAARAGTQTRYWWGDDIGRNNAVCAGCGSEWDSKRQTAPAGSFKANAFGLHDTVGNVREWTQDCWHKNYSGAPADGSAWLEKDGGDCGRRMVRGGSWGSGFELRSASRNSAGAQDYAGFRIARTL